MPTKMKHRGKARNSQQDCTTLQQIAEKPFRHGWDATRMRWYCTCRLTGDGKSQIQGHLPRKNQILHIQHLGIIGPVALSPQHHPRKKKNFWRILSEICPRKLFAKMLQKILVKPGYAPFFWAQWHAASPRWRKASHPRGRNQPHPPMASG